MRTSKFVWNSFTKISSPVLTKHPPPKKIIDDAFKRVIKIGRLEAMKRVTKTKEIVDVANKNKAGKEV